MGRKYIHIYIHTLYAYELRFQCPFFYPVYVLRGAVDGVRVWLRPWSVPLFVCKDVAADTIIATLLFVIVWPFVPSLFLCSLICLFHRATHCLFFYPVVKQGRTLIKPPRLSVRKKKNKSSLGFYHGILVFFLNDYNFTPIFFF